MLNVETRFEVPRIVDALQGARPRHAVLLRRAGHRQDGAGRAHRRSLDKPLLVKQASDLMSKFVGETEQNMAAMFREAETEKAVLLLDEADSFLQDRRGAQRTYEVTEVNEMLQGMERFAGIFVCTTNLLDRIDQAALRRFTFKIRFHAAHARAAGADVRRPRRWPAMRALTPEHAARLAKLDQLCPGDFAAVKRQVDILRRRSAPGSFSTSWRPSTASSRRCARREHRVLVADPRRHSREGGTGFADLGAVPCHRSDSSRNARSSPAAARRRRTFQLLRPDPLMPFRSRSVLRRARGDGGQRRVVEDHVRRQVVRPRHFRRHAFSAAKRAWLRRSVPPRPAGAALPRLAPLAPRRAGCDSDSRSMHLPLALEHARASLGELQRVERLASTATAPVAISWRSTPRSCCLAELGADAEGRRALVAELRDLLGRLAAQDVHDVPGAEADAACCCTR